MRVRREGLDLAPRAHVAERHGSRAWVQTRGALRAAAHGVGRAAAPSSAVPILKAAWPHVVAVHGAHAAPPVAIQLRLHLPQPTHRLVEIDQEDRQGRPTRVVWRPSWRVHHALRVVEVYRCSLLVEVCRFSSVARPRCDVEAPKGRAGDIWRKS